MTILKWIEIYDVSRIMLGYMIFRLCCCENDTS